MQQKAIPILSMTARRGDTTTTDGECMDIINVRNENGVSVPVTAPKEIIYLNEDPGEGMDNQDYHEFYYHDSAGKHLAIIHGGAGGIRIYDKNFTYLSTISISIDINNIKFVGNIMILFCLDKNLFFLYQDSSKNYIELGERPPMPEMRINISRKIFEHSYNVAGSGDSGDETYTKYIQTGVIDACIQKGNQSSYYIDRTMVRFALRLYDGSYVMHSGIFLIEDDCKLYIRSGADDWYLFEKSNIEKYMVEDGYPKIRVKMFKLGYTFTVSQALSKWRDIVVGIDVFTTKSIRSEKRFEGVIPTSKPSEADFSTETIADPDLIGPKVAYYDRDNDLRSKIVSESHFYKVASFDLEGRPIESNAKTDTSDDNLVLNEELTDDNGTHNILTSLNPFVYNSRLHLAGLKELLFEGYDTSQFIEYGFLDTLVDSDLIPNGPAGDNLVHIYVYLKTNEGEKVVSYKTNEGYTPHARLLTYPDYRAYQMKIIAKDEDYYDGLRYKIMTYPLTKHEHLNMSYYLNPINSLEEKNAVSLSPGADVKITYAYDTPPSYLENNIMNRSGVLKVSNIDNPFFFPSESTYTVGNGDIIGLASVATALSSGQVGDFPLYVFTNKGIYAMKVDPSGQIVYKNITALREDVCNNKDSITPALGGVFFTTDQGLMYMRGAEIQEMTEYIKNNFSIKDSLLKQIYEILGLPELTETMREYLSLTGINIAYLYKRNEIIVSTTSRSYSYVFSISSKSWYRISQSFEWFINAYPKVYGVKDARVYDIDLIEKDSANDILIISQPMLLESTSFKKVIQSVLRCDLYTNGPVGFYLLGSLDGNKYNLVFTKEIVDKDAGYHAVDMIAKMKRSKSYKYFAFAITGSLYCKSSINTIGLTYDDSMTNRLR